MQLGNIYPYKHYGCASLSYPNMTAFHTMMLFSEGAPLTPAGGSSCSLDKEIKNETVKAEPLKC